MAEREPTTDDGPYVPWPWVRYGPGQQCVTLEAAAQRLRTTVQDQATTARLAEVGGRASMMELAEVERFEGELC